MDEGKPVGVEAKAFCRFPVPVFAVSRHRTSQMSRSLNPDLILASRLQIESHQRMCPVGLEYLVVGDGIFPSIVHK